MPRGGGSRGGGFRGGGFRGGGFRGGGAAFRSGGRMTGTPFGRTGATRIVSRSPSGPYRHSPYYRRRYYGYRRYGWWRYRPWYWRWWYSPWWSGYYYRPWYYSPAYVGGGIVLMIILALIILPIAGVAIWFPFSSADPSGSIAYRSTETLYFNEYWYEYEYIESGNDITYSVQSSISPITFAIWNQPFENLPRTTEVGSEPLTQIDLVNNEYEYYQIYLRPGSSLSYNFNASNPVDFFIGDGNDLYTWDQGGSPVFYVDNPDTLSGVGSIPIAIAQDYYVVWYNDQPSSLDVNYTIDYSAADVVDFSSTTLLIPSTDNIAQNSLSVPSSGTWYFFIYFDPMDSPKESTEITFDVTYNTGVSSTDRWLQIQPILITIIVVIGIIIIAAFIARRGQKVLKTKAAKTKAKKTVDEDKKVEKTCIRCGAKVRVDSKFCPSCGGKIEGRTMGDPGVTTPAESKNCSYCGSKLTSGDNFCKWCGTKIAN